MIDIVLINYLEKSFAQTIKCCEKLNGNVILQDRSPRGVGSLAQAVNKGFSKVTTEYFLVVTNVTFNPTEINKFIQHTGYTAIQPTYASDHKHLRLGYGIERVPFTEFTFVLLHSNDFDKLGGVDELMPYVGFDIDYGIKASKMELEIACDFNYKVEHIYNRHLDYSIVTKRRKELRREAEFKTRQRLVELYGINHNDKLTLVKWRDKI
jgi:hypothetical protein